MGEQELRIKAMEFAVSTCGNMQSSATVLTVAQAFLKFLKGTGE